MSYAEKVKAQIVDVRGNAAEVGVFGSLNVAQPISQISLTFDRPLSAVREVIATGTPEAQVNRTLLRLQNGDAIETRRVLRYRTAQTIETYFTAIFNGTYDAGSDETYIGLFDQYDGVFVGYLGDQFVVGYRNVFADGGVGNEPDTIQAVTPPPEVNSKIYRYRVRFGYLGVGDITFEYKISGEDWTLLHTFATDGGLADRTHVGNVILPMTAKVEHTNGEIRSGSWNARTFGLDAGLQELPFFEDGERTVVGDTTPQPIVAFRSKTSFGGFPSKIRSTLIYSEIATGSEGLYKIEIYRFAPGTLVTGTWEDIDPDSVLERNSTFTEAASLGQKFLTSNLAVPSQGTGVAVGSLDYERLGVVAAPGDEFGVYKRELITGGGDDTTSWSIAYADQF